MALVCVNCRGPHLATDNSCPLLEPQKLIASLAATENIYLVEAMKRINQNLLFLPGLHSNINPFNEYEVGIDFTNFPQLPPLKHLSNFNLNNFPNNIFCTNRFERLSNMTEEMASPNAIT